MATYGDILSSVQLIIPRPELEALMRSKINQMISYISKSGYFWRDILEVTLDDTDGIDPSTYVQTVAIDETVRAISYVQYPAGSGYEAQKIARLTLEELATSWEEQKNCAYLSGNSLHLKHQYLSSSFKFAYYTSPVAFATDGTDDATSNWITTHCAGLVEDLTAAYILNLKGEGKDAAVVANLAAMMKTTYIRDAVTSVIN